MLWQYRAHFGKSVKNLFTKSMKQRIFPLLSVVLAAAEVVLVLLSWIIATVLPSSHFRSMLGGEGIRWFLGTFVDNISGNLIVWIILCSMAYGSFAGSGFCRAMVQLLYGGNITGRQRRAMCSALGVLVVFVVVVFLLAFVPHAILLGLSGDLFPSAFSASLVPLLAFVVTAMSFVYGFVCGTFTGVPDAFKSLCAGIVTAAPLFPVYILAVQLYYTARFVFVV